MDQQTFDSLPAAARASLNAITHGGTAQTLFLPDENPDDLYALFDDAFAHHQPATTEDAGLVSDSVYARWFLTRRQRIHANYEFQLHDTNPDPAFWSDASLNRLNLFDRYKTQAERALRRALTSVQTIRKDAFNRQRWQELLALRKEHLDLQRQKLEHTKEKDNRPFLQQQQEAEQKRADARRLAELIAKLQAFAEPIQSREEFGGCVIVQHVSISDEKGETYIDEIHPSNDKVRQIIRQRETYAEPPQEIVRVYNFLNNIPPEYEFLIDEDFPRPITEYCHFSAFMSFEEWHLLAEKEDEMLASQPEPDEDQDESDQY